MQDLDTETEVKYKGPLVSAPELGYIGEGDKRKAKCRLVFPKKCSGSGDINKKPYWLTVSCFGALAEQAAKLVPGQIVMAVGRVNCNRWYAKDKTTVKSSQNMIAFKVGVVASMDGPIQWLPGAPRKKKIEGKGEAVTHEDIASDDGGEDIDHEVADFLNSEEHAGAGAGKAQESVPDSAVSNEQSTLPLKG